MKTIDMMGHSCPIPVVEAKKILAEQDTEGVIVKVDNSVSVQNLGKMARGYGFSVSSSKTGENSFEVEIHKDGKTLPQPSEPDSAEAASTANSPDSLAVVISRDTLGGGTEELGKILIKGFIYSLSELPTPPRYVVFLNSGAYLTTEGANTVPDLKALEQKGTVILTCGVCANFYELQDKLAVGAISDMFDIVKKTTSVAKVMNI